MGMHWLLMCTADGYALAVDVYMCIHWCDCLMMCTADGYALTVNVYMCIQLLWLYHDVYS